MVLWRQRAVQGHFFLFGIYLHVTERQRKDKHAEAFDCAHRHMQRSQEGHRKVWSWKMSPSAFLSPPHPQWNGTREVVQRALLASCCIEKLYRSSLGKCKIQTYPESRELGYKPFLPQHPSSSFVTPSRPHSISPEPPWNTLLCLITGSPPSLASTHTICDTEKKLRFIQVQVWMTANCVGLDPRA